jgi:FKBP-type peptidyl-prolyl cis-trans isomerase
MQRAGEIQVEVFVAGDGINYPKKGHTVVVHYTGYVSLISNSYRCDRSNI